MAGRGGMKGSFGGIGTAGPLGGGGTGILEGRFGVSGSVSRQQEYPQPAASRERSSHAASVPPQGSKRVEHENEHFSGSRAAHTPRMPSGGHGHYRGGRGAENAMDSIEALGRCMPQYISVAGCASKRQWNRLRLVTRSLL